jgi:hypothetical protein
MLELRFDKEGNLLSAKVVSKPKLKPAKQRANQKRAKVWKTKIPKSLTRKEKNRIKLLKGL